MPLISAVPTFHILDRKVGTITNLLCMINFELSMHYLELPKGMNRKSFRFDIDHKAGLYLRAAKAVLSIPD